MGQRRPNLRWRVVGYLRAFRRWQGTAVVEVVGVVGTRATCLTCTDGGTALTSLGEGRRNAAAYLRCLDANTLAMNHPQTYWLVG